MSPTPEFTKGGKFYPTNNGERLPSVSTVLAALDELANGGPPYALIKWREKEIAAGRDPGAAANRGKKVHQFAEDYSLGLVPEFDEEVKPWVQQLEPLLELIYRQYGGPTHREQYCQARWYAGQLDQAILRLDSRSTILDFKTIGKPLEEDHPDSFEAELSKFTRKVAGWKSGSHPGVKKAFDQLKGYAAAWGDLHRLKEVNLLVVGITPDEAFVVSKVAGVQACVREWDSYEPLYHRAIEARAQRKLEQERKAQESALEEAARVSRMMETF